MSGDAAAGPKALCLFLSPSSAASGNQTTEQRIAGYLRERCVSVAPLNVTDRDVVAGLKPRVEALVADAKAAGVDTVLVVVLHAYRSGLHLETVLSAASGLRTKVLTIFGGTDIYMMCGDDEKLATMRRVVHRSDACVSFNPDMRTRAEAHFAKTDGMHVIPQAATVEPPSSGDVAGPDCRTLLEEAGVPAESLNAGAFHVFLAPMGVRHVKDPTFAAAAFAEHVRPHCANAYLLFLGPPLEEEEVKRLAPYCDPRRTGVALRASVPKSTLHQLFRDRSVATGGVLNCSIQEGQPQAAMEAMLCGAPVLLRSIPGNLAVASQGVTATFFDTPRAFGDACLRHIRDSAYTAALAANGKQHVLDVFATAGELAAYVALVGGLLDAC